MITRNQKKEINKIMNKHPERCSICKEYFDNDDRFVYTVFGYDKYNRMQLTTGCCAEFITRPISLGICGCFDPSDYEEILKDHPLAESFFEQPSVKDGD